MSSRCDPLRRRYTELCNRSGIASPPVSRPSLMQTQSESLEDYWEDSSVSIRSCRSWEPSSSPWLTASGLHPPMDASYHESDGSHDAASRHSRPCRYSFDGSDHLSSAKVRRCFPPPLASCSTLSIKEGGRFVLKEMDADRPQGFFRAQRDNGRLVLQFILPENSSDEVEALENDGNQSLLDNGGFIDGDECITSVVECSKSVVECSDDSVAGMCDQLLTLRDATQNFHEVHQRERSDCLYSEEDVCCRNGGNSLEEGHKGGECASGTIQCEGGGDPFCFCEGYKAADIDAGPVQKEDGTCLAGGDSSADGNQIVNVENRLGADIDDDVGLREKGCSWDVDARNHSTPSLGTWSPNQVYLQPPLVNMPTVYGLAMS